MFQEVSSGCCGKNGLKGNQDRYGKTKAEDSTGEESLSPAEGWRQWKQIELDT